MYIQLCNINDCHGNDYDAFGKRRDRIGCCGDGHGGLVTVETGARVGRHESTYRTIRGHVTYDTRARDLRYAAAMVARAWATAVCAATEGSRAAAEGTNGRTEGSLRDGGGLMGTAAGTRGAAMGKKRESHGPSRTHRVLLGPGLCHERPGLCHEGPWLCHEGAGIRTCALRARCSLPDGLSLHRCCRGRRRHARCRGCPDGR